MRVANLWHQVNDGPAALQSKSGVAPVRGCCKTRKRAPWRAPPRMPKTQLSRKLRLRLAPGRSCIRSRQHK